MPQVFWHVGTNFQSNHTGKFSCGQFVGHHTDEEAGGGVGIKIVKLGLLPRVILSHTGYAEKVAGEFSRFGEQLFEIGSDYLL